MPIQFTNTEQKKRRRGQIRSKDVTWHPTCILGRSFDQPKRVTVSGKGARRMGLSVFFEPVKLGKPKAPDLTDANIACIARIAPAERFMKMLSRRSFLDGLFAMGAAVVLAAGAS
jgi:hypothetical protein